MAEIERDLQREGVSPRLRYHIRFQQEQIIELQMQMEKVATLLTQFFEALAQLRVINEELNNRWSRQLKGLNPIEDDEVVKSVLNEPEEKPH